MYLHSRQLITVPSANYTLDSFWSVQILFIGSSRKIRRQHTWSGTSPMAMKRPKPCSTRGFHSSGLRVLSFRGNTRGASIFNCKRNLAMCRVFLESLQRKHPAIMYLKTGEETPAVLFAFPSFSAPLYLPNFHK